MSKFKELFENILNENENLVGKRVKIINFAKSANRLVNKDKRFLRDYPERLKNTGVIVHLSKGTNQENPLTKVIDKNLYVVNLDNDKSKAKFYEWPNYHYDDTNIVVNREDFELE